MKATRPVIFCSASCGPIVAKSRSSDVREHDGAAAAIRSSSAMS
jgi:hypothetical protein